MDCLGFFSFGYCLSQILIVLYKEFSFSYIILVLFWVCSEQDPEEMACLLTTYQTGICIHCTKGHKRCGLPTSIHHVSPRPFTWLLGETVEQGLVLEENLQYLFEVLVT